MRVASLVPSATELLFALGLGDSVVAVTHECDYPPDASDLPHLTRSVIPEGLSAAEIDAEVRSRTERGAAIYELDADRLHELQPDLIVTQAVCEVCAVSIDDVRKVAADMDPEPQVISLDPSTFGEVLADVRRLAEACDVEEAGEQLIAEAADRLDRVAEAVAGADRPGVLALEWLDPLFIGGHWVPQMIEMAGGVDAVGFAGEKSQVVDPAVAQAAGASLVVLMPCGYDAERAAQETRDHAETVAAFGADRVVAVDASAYFSRPGPRLVDGVELLAHVLHPDRVEPPPPGRFVELDTRALAGAGRGS
jgi:iron complex transport system substrate-binding protein